MRESREERDSQWFVSVYVCMCVCVWKLARRQEILIKLKKDTKKREVKNEGKVCTKEVTCLWQASSNKPNRTRKGKQVADLIEWSEG